MAAKDSSFDFASHGDETEAATTVGVDLFTDTDVPDYETLESFGEFQVLGRLARGGMAEVYLARKIDPGGVRRHLVLKRILPAYADDARFLELFRQEGALAVRLYHPNVCHVYECGERDGRPFLALEWVYGLSLRDMLRRAQSVGGVPVGITLEIFARIADALHYIHHARGTDGNPLNIIHRDVSPHNVMVGWDGAVKLLDFGIAKTTVSDEKSSSAKGKVGYFSPEQLFAKELDGRTDVFSLGICFWEALAGERLYRRASIPETMTAIASEPAPSVRTIRPAITEELDAIVARTLAKDRDERLATAGALRDALRSYATKSGLEVSTAELVAFLDRIVPGVDRYPLPPGSGQLRGPLAHLPTEDSWSSLLVPEPPTEVAKPAAATLPPPVTTRAQSETVQGSPPSDPTNRLVGALVGAGVLGIVVAAVIWFLYLR